LKAKQKEKIAAKTLLSVLAVYCVLIKVNEHRNFRQW